MPPRPAPGDRLKIEAALSEAQLRGLEAVCETLGVPREEWQDRPALHWTFVTTAVLRLAGQIRKTGRCTSARGSIEAAAIRLDVPPDTILSRVKD